MVLVQRRSGGSNRNWFCCGTLLLLPHPPGFATYAPLLCQATRRAGEQAEHKGFMVFRVLGFGLFRYFGRLWVGSLGFKAHGFSG